MTFLGRFSRSARQQLRRKQAEADMAEEMRFHLEQREADYAEDGLSSEEAKYAAQRRFGNMGRLQEQAREESRWVWFEQWLKDARLGARRLLKSPGFTIVAVITLGLGIGANTAMFSLLNEVLLRPFAFFEAENLDRVFRATSQNPEGRFSVADYLDVSAATQSYGELAAYTPADMSLHTPVQPAEMTNALRISANLFNVLGVVPELGRLPTPEEEARGRNHVLVISHRFWQSHFAGDPGIVGRSFRVDGEAHEVIGVLPASFNDWRYLGYVDLFRPLGLSQEERSDRKTATLRLLGRRAKERTRAEFEAFLTGFGERLAKQYPDENAGTRWRIESLRDSLSSGSNSAILTMLVGLSLFVLLIACSNLANLFLARAITRSREFAVRAALGASRVQLLRPLIIEALLLAFAGALAAVVVALWSFAWLVTQSMNDQGDAIHLGLNWHVLGWMIAASLLTAVAFGAAPALYALRLDINDTLKSGARGATGTRGHQRLRRFLIVGQFALAMVLLCGSGMFVRGLKNLNQRRYGWESKTLVTGTVRVPVASLPEDEAVANFQRLAVEKLEALPGVEAASLSHVLPFAGSSDLRRFIVAGQTVPEAGHEPAALMNGVSPHYFATTGMPLQSGRTFGNGDTKASPRVYIINQSMARGLFGDESPLGHRLAQVGGEKVEWGEIVGVVGDVHAISLAPSRVEFQIYSPLTQEPSRFTALGVRAGGASASSLVESIRKAITSLNPEIPLRDLMPADKAVEEVLYQFGVAGKMLASLALLGLGLAAVGIYGVVSFTVSQRTSEFGVRIALGASPAGITRLVMLGGVKLALVGAAVGLLGALGIAKLIATALPGMSTESVLVMLGVTALLVGVALLACWIPARRACRIDPVTALRAE